MIEQDFATFVAERFGGTLYEGAHAPDGKACLHEALNVYQGKSWSDDTTGTLDLRSLNDAPWSSDEARTAAMLPLGALVLAWPSWTSERRQAWAKKVAAQTIRQIVPLALRAAGTALPTHREALEAAAQRCANEGTEASAWAARSAAGSASGSAWAARSSARSARWAAESAAKSAAKSAAESAAWAAKSAAKSAAGSAESAAWDAPLRLIAQIMAEAA